MKGVNRFAPVAVAGLAATLAARRLRRRAGMDFAGRAVVIVGGSRGLGLVLAREFAAEGARLTLIARDRAELARAERDLAALGASVLTLPCDLRARDEARAAIERTVEHYGAIDVLVNNAGVMQVGPVEHMTIEDFEEALDVHFWGPLTTTLAAAPHMRRQGGGRIVNIASIGGKLAVPHLLPYAASKFALVGLSDGLRAELAKDGIAVTTVCPGLMRTGSPPNAFFKGRHRAEYAWFAALDASPLVSIDARRAARQILDACRHGDPELTITWQARLAVIANALFPGLMARALILTNRLLPAPAPGRGEERRTGWDSRSGWAPSLLTRLSDRATAENNEATGHRPVA